MINIAVEGESDREAAAAVVRTAGHEVAKIVVAGGKSRLDPKIPNYNTAAAYAPWVVFRDSDSDCPVELLRKLAPPLEDWNKSFCLRIAKSMTESWLMADSASFSKYFKIKAKIIPQDPDALTHAKRALLQLCKDSSSRDIQRDMVAADGRAGPLYASRLNEFASQHWDVTAAANRSNSLARALKRIGTISFP
ncbi:hypothetical protein [Austwickia chelonae]|uniref:hypothetical protein n=1 Tax=Austwickia chelonae TaxID=100225 RepID=UPI001967DC2A|nr:hypothetical protein [Austwickia chelonae]